MPKIISIKDLKNTSVISAMCHVSEEPIYITKNGYVNHDNESQSVKFYKPSKYSISQTDIRIR